MARRYDGTLYGGAHDEDLTTWRRSVVQRLVHVLRQLIGAPDYAAYVEHCRRAGHSPRLGEREYVAEFFAAKGRGVRCC